MQLRRDTLPPRDTHGVQTLVVRKLGHEGVRHEDDVLVLGMGEMGRATTRALERAGFTDVATHGRTSLGKALEVAQNARAVVITAARPRRGSSCPSASAAW